MHKVLQKGLSLASKFTSQSKSNVFKGHLNNISHNILNQRLNAINKINQYPLYAQFSSMNRQNGEDEWDSQNNNKPRQNQNYNNNSINKEQDNSKVQQNSTTRVNNKFFYSHTQVSKHFVLQEEDIYALLNKFNIQYKKSHNDEQIKIEWCPFCLKPHNNDVSNSFTLGIKKSTGQFNCFRCLIKGSWWDLKNLLYKNISVRDIREYNETLHQEERMDDSEFYLYHQQLLDKETYKEELQYLCGKQDEKQRHINYETLMKYKIGIGKEEFMDRDGDFIKVPVVYFPMFKYEKPVSGQSDDEKIKQEFEEDSGEQQKITISSSTYKLVKAKIRGIGPQYKRYMRVKPSGSKSGIFGLNTIPENAKEVVITEGEYDAMAVYQATGLPAISLPYGASTIPLEAIGCLDQFEKIYLWLDNDEVGRNNRNKLAEKLGLNRTYIVNTLGEKDANDILRQDPSRIQTYLNKSSTIPDQNILTFSDLREQVQHRLIKFENNYGIRSRRFNFYNDTIKGLRKGEMTVLTGPTGSGKTTFLAQLSLDFCQQQVPTLWGSFEIKNEILATNMVLQMSGQDLFKQNQKFPYWADRFEMLPMYYMNFFGSTSLEQIISTIEYSIYKYDIQHVVIDNLQFLLGTQARGFDKFDLQDKSIEAFRQLATKNDIHLTLVIHPKKVEESEDLNISSVFGSAKATQEADNVIILQNRDNFRVIDIKKNRFNGDVGKKAIIFDKSNKNFYEMNHSEVAELMQCKKAGSDIVKSKIEQLLQIIDEEDFIQPIQSNPLHKKSNNGDDNDGGNNNGSSGSNSNPTQPPPNNPPNTSNSSSNQASDSFNQEQSQSNISNNTQQPEQEVQKQNKQQTENNKDNESNLNINEDPDYNIVNFSEEIQVDKQQEQQKQVKMKVVEKKNNSAKQQQEQKKEINLNDLNLDEIEAYYKKKEAVENIESSLSVNYNYEDDYNEAVQEEAILAQINSSSMKLSQDELDIEPQFQSTPKKQKQYIPEEYDTDSLEPVFTNIYDQNKEVKPTTTFFKNFNPVSLEQRENLLNGSFRQSDKKNNTYKNNYGDNNKQYKKYNKNDSSSKSDIDDQIFENRISSRKKKQLDVNIENEFHDDKKNNNNNN